MGETRKRRVLVVDDEASVVLLCAIVLREAGFEVHSATHTTDAIELLRANTYDALLVDLVMPEGGGIAVLEAARVDAPGLPTILMTAEPRHLATYNPAADYYLFKPFDGLKSVEELVSRAIRERAPATGFHAA